MSKKVTVDAKVLDANYSIATNEIVLSLNVEGKRRSSKLTKPQVLDMLLRYGEIKELPKEGSHKEMEILNKCARDFVKRVDPIKILTTEEMLSKEGDLHL